MAAVQIFKALGDPTRLEMVRRLSNDCVHTISSLSSELGISRQGARKQIQVLVSAQLITLQPVGREVRVSIDRSTLNIAKLCITDLENQWDQRLRRLKKLAENKH